MSGIDTRSVEENSRKQKFFFVSFYITKFSIASIDILDVGQRPHIIYMLNDLYIHLRAFSLVNIYRSLESDYESDSSIISMESYVFQDQLLVLIFISILLYIYSIFF